jgi:hypothetical protein
MKSLTPPLFVWLKNCLALYEVEKSRSNSDRRTSVHSKMRIPGRREDLSILAILQFALISKKITFKYKGKVDNM